MLATVSALDELNTASAGVQAALTVFHENWCRFYLKGVAGCGKEKRGGADCHFR